MRLKKRCDCGKIATQYCPECFTVYCDDCAGLVCEECAPPIMCIERDLKKIASKKNKVSKR